MEPEKINKKNKQTNAAGSHKGKPKLADCRQPPVAPSQGPGARSSDVRLDVSPSTSKAANYRTPQGVPTASKTVAPFAPCLTAAVPGSSAPVVPLVPTGDGPTAPLAAANTNKTAERDRKQRTRRLLHQYRAARRHVEKLGTTPAEALSEDEKRNLTWAKAYLADNPDPEAGTAVMAAKRQRSRDEVNRPSKKPRQGSTVINRPYSEVAKNPLIRALVDRSNSDGSITRDQWGLISQKLLEDYLRAIGSNTGPPPPQCRDAGWFQGRVKLLECADERSAAAFAGVVATLGEVWPGARLQLVPVSEIPRRPRAVAVVPAEPHDPAAILRIFQTANPDLPTLDWRVVSVEGAKGPSRKVVLLLNRESLPSLRSRQGMVYYGYLGTRLCLYRGDSKLDHAASSSQQPADNMATADKQADQNPQENAAEDVRVPSDSASLGSSQSDSGLIGEFFSAAEAEVDEDEDALLDSDPENVTILNYDPDNEDGGDTD